MVLGRLKYFLEYNNILTGKQASFRSSKSTVDQILFLSQSIAVSFRQLNQAHVLCLQLLIKPFCCLLRETTRAWMLQLCLPSLTESGGIDGPRQFGALTSHTLVEKRGVF